MERARWRDGGGVLGVVVHPQRELGRALDAARQWAEARGGAMRQVTVAGQERRVADPVEAEDCDLLLALGGDGTVLAALRAALGSGRSVLGVACGSLGVLTSVHAKEIESALDRFASGAFDVRAMSGLEVRRDDEVLGVALNDVVVVRAGAGQVMVEVDVDGEPYAGLAGDGVIAATSLGSSAYTIAAGGPLLATASAGMVVTPLPFHGGSVPPVVLGPEGRATLRVTAGYLGSRVELDGRGVHEGREPFELEVRAMPQSAVLLDFDGETLIAGLRRRGVIADSPRVGVRAARTQR